MSKCKKCDFNVYGIDSFSFGFNYCPSCGLDLKPNEWRIIGEEPDKFYYSKMPVY